MIAIASLPLVLLSYMDNHAAYYYNTNAQIGIKIACHVVAEPTVVDLISFCSSTSFDSVNHI